MSIKGVIREFRGIFQRNQPTQTRTYFTGAKQTRMLSDWMTSSSTADAELLADLRLLRARSRDLLRNDPVVRQFVNLSTSNIIGHRGPKMQAQVRDNGPKKKLNKRINDALEAGWADWATGPMADSKKTLVEFYHQCIKSLISDGEIFVRKITGYNGNRFRFALQLIDPEQIDSDFNRAAAPGQNEIRLGVEVDEFGKPVAYWVTMGSTNDVNTSLRAAVRKRIPASEIEHLYDSDRVGQTRGVPRLAPVISKLKQLDNYDEAALIAAKVGASQMGFIEDTNPDALAEDLSDDGSQPTPALMTMEADPGTVTELMPGKKFTSWNPNYPNGEFAVFTKAILRKIASGLGVSYNSLANDLESINYSSIRSGMLIERDMWRILQEWIITRLITPIYNAWLEAALLAGALRLDSRDPAKFKMVKWVPRGWAWVDPLKDVNAAVIAINNGLGCRTDYTGEQGRDLEEIYESLGEEATLAAQYGVVYPTAPAPAPDPLADPMMTDEEDDSDPEDGDKKKKMEGAE